MPTTEDRNMPRLTLRTLLAYLDDTLETDQARSLGRKVAESDEAKALIERIKKVTRRRGLTAPTTHGDDHDVSDPNTVAAYLSDNLEGEQVRELEETCLESDVHLAEVAACHQILTLVLTEPVRVPPSANQRMYRLVEAPASDLRRKPGKSLPVGGVAPRSADSPDTDDPDAALLLGMKRYSASDSWAGRIGLVAAVVAVAAFLVLAVLMALPHDSKNRPEVSSTVTYAAIPTPPTPPLLPPPLPGTGTGETPIAPEPKAGDPKKEPEPKPPEVPDPKKEPDPKADPGPKLDDPVKAPLIGAEVLGKMETANVIVVTRANNANSTWKRLDPEPLNPAKPVVIRASDLVMALPGYKADVKLESGVVVHLWGNVPEQVSMKSMVMQSRVRFHPPPGEFAADISLDTGRIYLTTTKAAGAKVRVRIGGDLNEVWDIALTGNTTDVLVQVNTAFLPGTKDKGDKPLTEARLVVLRGAADFKAPRRDPGGVIRLAVGDEALWDSIRGTLTKGKPTKKDDIFPERGGVLLEAGFGKALQGVFTKAATELVAPKELSILLKEGLVLEPPERYFKGGLSLVEYTAIAFPTKFAAYSQGAITDGTEAPELLDNLIDLLKDRGRRYAREAAVVSLSSWVAQAPGNTDLLLKELDAKGLRDTEPDIVAGLLRGYASFAGGDTSKVDHLVKWLDHEHIAVRELALGNLIAYFDPEAVKEPALFGMDVALRGEPPYTKFLAGWKTRGDEIKAKMREKK